MTFSYALESVGNKIGAAALSKLEEPFEPAAGTSGTVASCAETYGVCERPGGPGERAVRLRSVDGG